MINKLYTNNNNFLNTLNYFLEKGLNIKNLEEKIKNIIYNIKNYKEKAIIYYQNKFNNNNLKTIREIFIQNKDMRNSYNKLDNNLKYSLEICKNKIENFHLNQLNNFINNIKIKNEEKLNIINIKIPIQNLGIYIPGGKAVYPSSVFMNCLPAKVLNINNINVASPIKKNSIVLAALYMLDIKNVLNLGGVQAIASLAYGFKNFKKCDKIYGPGNIYVALAKKILFGEVGIDSVAGPSELTIFLNDTKNIYNTLMDFFSQSEHDELAQSILLIKDENILDLFLDKINKYIPYMYKKDIIKKSLNNKSLIIKLKNNKELINLINYISPEHLMINKNNNNIIKYITNYGSLFLNNYSSESFGDYISGINHVLPTNKNSRFSSGLNINDFIKISNILKTKKLNFNKLSSLTSFIALNESLYCHSENLILRKNEKNLWNF